MHTKRTKIVATIGPATESKEMLEQLFLAGVNMARLNFSHGDHPEHQARVDKIKILRKKLGLPVAILQDLSGPKIRIGEFYQERVTLTEGEKFVLTTKKIIGDEHKAYVNYAKLPKEVKKGGTIFLDDGKKRLEIEKIVGSEIHCRIIAGGETKGRRGVNVPGAYLSLSSLTDKDRDDLVFGVKNDVEYMALSFVRQAKDVQGLKDILKKKKANNIKIISKIETLEAIENIDQIIEVSDGIMVARGDLAIEVPAEEVPMMQKTIIHKCNKAGKPVITATQMLESMIHTPVPTRAEVSDVANAIFDGTDAIMLSEETTLGKYPVRAVEVMKRVAAHNEDHIDYGDILGKEHLIHKKMTDSFSYAALNIRHEIGGDVIVALSQTGYTARMMSRHKPKKPLVVLTSDEKTYNQLALSWGCYPIMTREFKTLAETIDQTRKVLLQHKIAKKGDIAVIVAGIPFGQAGGTNTVIAETV
ncbi:MAG: pyruvate kinase [bacterium]